MNVIVLFKTSLASTSRNTEYRRLGISKISKQKHRACSSLTHIQTLPRAHRAASSKGLPSNQRAPNSRPPVKSATCKRHPNISQRHDFQKSSRRPQQAPKIASPTFLCARMTGHRSSLVEISERETNKRLGPPISRPPSRGALVSALPIAQLRSQILRCRCTCRVFEHLPGG